MRDILNTVNTTISGSTPLFYQGKGWHLPTTRKFDDDFYVLTEEYENKFLTDYENHEIEKKSIDELVEEGVYIKIKKNRITSIKEAIKVFYTENEVYFNGNATGMRRLNKFQIIQNKEDATSYLENVPKEDLIKHILNYEDIDHLENLI